MKRIYFTLLVVISCSGEKNLNERLLDTVWKVDQIKIEQQPDYVFPSELFTCYRYSFTNSQKAKVITSTGYQSGKWITTENHITIIEQDTVKMFVQLIDEKKMIWELKSDSIIYEFHLSKIDDFLCE